MSYIPDTNSRADFFNSRSPRTLMLSRVAIKQFDIFCDKKYQRTGDQILKDLKEVIDETRNDSKIYTILQQFTTWLGEEHPDIIVKLRQFSRPMKKRHPSTIKNYLGVIKQYFEEFGGIEISDRKCRKRVKLPIEPKVEYEPLTEKEIRLFIDIASPSKKLLYRVLKDSGMRIGEAVQLTKENFELSKTPIEIHIPAEFTMTKQGRTTFVTSETSHRLKNKLEQIGDILVLHRDCKSCTTPYDEVYREQTP